jgi:hypothetical protein
MGKRALCPVMSLHDWAIHNLRAKQRAVRGSHACGAEKRTATNS